MWGFLFFFPPHNCAWTNFKEGHAFCHRNSSFYSLSRQVSLLLVQQATKVSPSRFICLLINYSCNSLGIWVFLWIRGLFFKLLPCKPTILTHLHASGNQVLKIITDGLLCPAPHFCLWWVAYQRSPVDILSFYPNVHVNFSPPPAN